MNIYRKFIAILMLIVISMQFTYAKPKQQEKDSEYLDIRKKNLFYLSGGLMGNVIKASIKNPKVRFFSWNASFAYRFSDKFHSILEVIANGNGPIDKTNYMYFINAGIDPFGFSNFDAQANIGVGLSSNEISPSKILGEEKSLMTQLQLKAAYNGSENTFCPFVGYRFIRGKNINFNGIEIGLNVSFS